MKKIIFVGGIHGVGKTYFCNELCKKFDVSHFSASQLIAQQTKEEMNNSKNVLSIQSNQDSLVTAIHNFSEDINQFLLDGHFCLRNIQGNIERIPEKTFLQLQPACFIVLTDDVEHIKEKLKTRDSVEYSRQFLEEFQTEEVEYAKEIATRMNTPLFIYPIKDNEKELYEFINSYF